MGYSVLYFAFVDSHYGGVEQKILSQYDSMVRLGKNIQLFLVSSCQPGERLAKEIQNRQNIKSLINTPDKLRSPFSRRKEKFEMILTVLRGFNPENTVVYFRYPLADFIFYGFLKKIPNYKIVTEHQEIENTFSKGKFNGNYMRNSMEMVWGRSVRKLLTGFVGVTSEITDYERSLVGRQGKFFSTIGNGINVSRYPLRSPTKDRGSHEVRLLFVGAGFKTHGLARLLKSIYDYQSSGMSKYNIVLKVAGESSEMNKNRELAARLQLQSQVHFLGNLEKELLDDLFDWADVGVGSLAIHRIGLLYSSTLKAREYCARGLPFILSNVDDDFPSDNPYVLQLEPNDAPFDLSKVISFAEKVVADEEHPKKMRAHAIQHLDWDVKIGTLLPFFDSVAKS